MCLTNDDQGMSYDSCSSSVCTEHSKVIKRRQAACVDAVKMAVAETISDDSQSPTTVFVRWSCRLCIQGSTMTISSWSGFQLTSSGNVCPQRCSSSGVSSTTLRSCHRCPRHSTLVASTTAGGLQGSCHGVSGATRTCAALSELTSSGL